jgi:hypothetical protein
MGAPLWSDEDVLIISVMVDFLTLKELSDRTGRSEGAVRRKLHDLGLRVKHHPPRKKPPSTWSDEDLKYLKSAVKSMTVRHIANRLNKPTSAVSYKLKQLGMPVRSVRGYLRDGRKSLPNGKKWTEKEKAYLRDQSGKKTASQEKVSLSKSTLGLTQRWKS